MTVDMVGSDSDLETVRGSDGSAEAAHREAMMDTENMSRNERVLVSEAMVASRGDDDGHDPITESMVVEGQDWPNVEPTWSTFKSVSRLLWKRKAFGVTFIIPREDQRPWSPPKGYQCVYESYFKGDTKLWFPIPRLVTAYTMRRGAALSQFLNGAWRLAVALVVIGAEAGVALNVRAFEELVSVKIHQGLISLKIRPNYNVVTGYPTKTNNWQRSYFYVKSDRAAFEEPLKTGYRVLWNNEIVPHSNSEQYEEEFLESARVVASRKQDHWDNFSFSRIRESAGRIRQQVWRSNTIPIITKRSKRINLFNKDEQREINRARAMRELPDLSLIVENQLGFMEPDQAANTDSPDLGDPNVTELDVETRLAGKKSSKKKRQELAASEERQPEETSAGGDTEPEKKRARKDPVEARASSVEEGELRALEPSGGSHDGGVPDLSLGGDRAEGAQEASSKAKKKKKSKKSKKKDAGGSSEQEVATDAEQGTSEVPTAVTSAEETAAREDAGEPNKPPLRAPQEKKDAPKKVQGFCPDKVDFIYKRDTPLFAATRNALASSDRFEGSQGDWNVVVGKYDKALKEAYATIDSQRRNGKEATRALEDMLRKKDEAVIREELFQKEAAMNKELKRARELVKKLEGEKAKLAGDKETLEKKMAAADSAHSKEMDRLRDSRRYEVTHERIRVMAAMHGKCAVRFKRIQDRETRRDKFEDARCMLGQARGMRRCLEGMKATGKNIPQEDIDTYAGLEKHYDAEMKRLDVGELPEKDLSLSPLVLESRFVIQKILDRVDKYGSNRDLLDSEAAKALRTPLREQGDRSEGPSKSLLETIQSHTFQRFPIS
ncbi:meiosis-specific protein ASY2-like [Raphanus sativus]|uniref:Meiosis-specific protein ASY2-like n=1 Tax=Raphanus sativus TaxID=3726 RepID=A0A6J0MND8_RAPSA|nr:meiosis-specific protein ASY2-like [Raphanus sativus]